MVINSIDGTVTQKINYDEFGVVLEDTNPGFQPFYFVGGIYDTDTKLVRFGARDYDAEIGRWTSKDAILFDSGDTLMYGYCGNDPINYTDINGYFRYHGYWCGPDWTGGHDGPYVPGKHDYLPYTDSYDACCMVHDISYYKCRKEHQCDSEARGQCMTDADRLLAECAEMVGRSFSPLYWWMKNNNSPDAGPNGDPDTGDCDCGE